MAHQFPNLLPDEEDRSASWPTRRHVLQIGSLAGMGLLLPDLLRAQTQIGTAAKGTFGRAKSVIVLYLHGGHAQQETWDPKPDGPYPERGEFGAIATSLPGARISELLPSSARLMHKLAVIRSLSHANANHVQASLPALTGHAHPPSEESRGDFPPSPSDFPPFGAVLDHLRPPGKLPTWVQAGPLMRRANGTVLHGQSPGFLGSKHSPLVIDQDLIAEDVRIGAVTPDPELSLDRLSGRRDLLQHIDNQRRLLDRNAETRSLDTHQQRALNLLTSAAVGQAFQLAAEPAAIRDRYGRTQFGQCCLLARRLAEAGVPMINVHYCRTPMGSWDTHSQHFRQMKESLCPIFDAAFSSLVADLDQRGLLRQTLVLATAEFGRTPKVNSSAGRDHWPWVYSVALAGGGAAAGVVVGSSDKSAAYPTSHPHDPRDLAATVYHLLGVPADTIVQDQTHRPYPLVIGQQIDGLLA
ncbi:MAG TPA: DUF1501 domain-containing protein [Gemmataceae bacterium]|nr:DUF1501 domain-containing protein [Gemmataceae bacterium]